MNPPKLTLLVLAVVLGVLSGCTSHRSGPYSPTDPERRDTAAAERLTREAADLIASNPTKAEELLREALTADLFHGAAHNNLGVLYLNAGQLYEAAGEFEWARKLMPGHPDPRLNLGLALERGGRIDEAIEAYRTALALAPEHLPTLQALTRCQIRHARQDASTITNLEHVAMNASPQWQAWAQDQLLAVRAKEP